MKLEKSLLCIGITLALSACGGSDSGSSGGSAVGGDNDYAFCSAEYQNEEFFEYMKEDYFWASQLQDSLDPEAFDDVYAVLEELRVQRTPTATFLQKRNTMTCLSVRLTLGLVFLWSRLVQAG